LGKPRRIELARRRLATPRLPHHLSSPITGSESKARDLPFVDDDSLSCELQPSGSRPAPG
jgi:hypothetical protein